MNKTTTEAAAPPDSVMAEVDKARWSEVLHQAALSGDDVKGLTQCRARNTALRSGVAYRTLWALFDELDAEKAMEAAQRAHPLPNGLEQKTVLLTLAARQTDTLRRIEYLDEPGPAAPAAHRAAETVASTAALAPAQSVPATSTPAASKVTVHRVRTWLDPITSSIERAIAETPDSANVQAVWLTLIRHSQEKPLLNQLVGFRGGCVIYEMDNLNVRNFRSRMKRRAASKSCVREVPRSAAECREVPQL